MHYRAFSVDAKGPSAQEAESNDDRTMGKDESSKENGKPDGSSILELQNAVKYCAGEVKKFDFYTYVAG